MSSLSWRDGKSFDYLPSEVWRHHHGLITQEGVQPLCSFRVVLLAYIAFRDSSTICIRADFCLESESVLLTH